ncbi:MAG: beta-N-acetylhexosaminidase [Magnetococcales bacterium]|nr:beta-N-acetylhexosaminidase [Magnetococcales bacterium]
MTIDAGRHLIMGIEGLELTSDEAAFLAANHIAGVILFSRNIVDMVQVQRLIGQIRGAASPPPTLWIDQEGGRVQRLKMPFTNFPSPFQFSYLAQHDLPKAERLLEMAGRLCGLELASLGIGVNCAPVLDLREPGADPVIGERAFSDEPAQAITLIEKWLDGFQPTGVMPIGKHFPGHGAATSDSHKTLPVLDCTMKQLETRELLPFHHFRQRLPAFMTAHISMRKIDPDNPATCSQILLIDLLRDKWNFKGLIVSDALEMGALSGTMEERAYRTVIGGCDLLLSCTGAMEDNQQTLAGIIRALEKLDPARHQATQKRIDRILPDYRLTPGDPTRLLEDSDYFHDRNEVERLTEERFSIDPTERAE